MSTRLAGWLSLFKDGLLQLLYPNTCWACGEFLPESGQYFCECCQNAVTRDPHPACPRCAATVGPNLNPTHDCGHCRQEKYAFDGALRMGPYDGFLRDMILRLKNRHQEGFAEVIGAVWAKNLAPRLHQMGAQAVVPVPLHWTRRYWERGFNQSEILAECLAKNLGIPCYRRCLRRVRRTARQTEQTPAGRRENVRGAFCARHFPELKDKCVLLVDDVLTTGATASEAAKALRTLQPRRIIAVVLAHSK